MKTTQLQDMIDFEKCLAFERYAGGHDEQMQNLFKGAFVTPEMLKMAMMSEEQEGRAHLGYCPKCGEHKLKITGPGGAGMAFKLCAACGTSVVFSDMATPVG